MLASEIKPDNFTFACVLRACSERLDLDALKVVHGQLIASDMGLDSICGSALVSAYSKLARIDDARMVFDRLNERDLVLYNTMISGYGSCGYWMKGLHLFIVMRRMGDQPDGYTVVGLLSGLTWSSLLEIGQEIHGYCLRNGFDSNAHYGEYRNALVSFKEMNMEGRKPDSILIATLLAVTAQMVVLSRGVEIHGYAIRHNLDTEIMVSSALVDMYSKCGFLDLGIKVFEQMPKRNIVSYNSIIASLGLYGHSSWAFEVFREVLEKGLKPDESTFSALLSACCHGGLVKEGREFLRRMDVDFGIKAKTEHYVHFVKLIGMAGELEEAYKLVDSLGGHVDSGIWGALLSCCDVHNDSKMAELVAQRLFDNKPDKSTYKVTLSNLHAGNGRWDDVKNLRDELDDVGNKKIRGTSWIEI